MAYDKVVDSTALETAITATANAIREKTGNTELLEWVAGKGFADVIAAIESGGGGEILGHKFACGSFTLTEDTTTTYTILTANELFEAVKDDFTGAVNLASKVWTKGNTQGVNLYDFLAAICWIDNTEVYNATTQAKQYLAAFLPKHSLNNSSSAAIYTDSYGNFVAKSVNGIIKVDFATGLTAGFGANYTGYAGSKYNWLVIPLDHGEVQ